LLKWKDLATFVAREDTFLADVQKESNLNHNGLLTRQKRSYMFSKS